MGEFLIFWIAFTACFAGIQGLLMPTLRDEGRRWNIKVNDFALHKVGFVAWLLPVVLSPSWPCLVIAFLIRFAIFDLCVNFAAGDNLFYVGNTAKTDRLLRWVAEKLRVPVQVLSAFLKCVAVLVLFVILWVN